MAAKSLTYPFLLGPRCSSVSTNSPFGPEATAKCGSKFESPSASVTRACKDD